MSEVQGTIDFSVELHKFHNVDLFQRGSESLQNECFNREPHDHLAVRQTFYDISSIKQDCWLLMEVERETVAVKQQEQ
ncbi:hypothetical protein JRQ81_010799 [Phrynocephalus forsythii]|uniref:Uncharacterized protein n=1 Tax=Phrynocephalus forsythii TaxID=171643 RepID=A0A9Q0Y1G3_9SAUR|nr:hypothetical protein JRQ81_010799 [Phrynocephalus forsythii]